MLAYETPRARQLELDFGWFPAPLGTTAAAPPMFSVDRERNQRELRALADRLRSRRNEIHHMAFGHHGPLAGIEPLLVWSGAEEQCLLQMTVQRARDSRRWFLSERRERIRQNGLGGSMSRLSVKYFGAFSFLVFSFFLVATINSKAQGQSERNLYCRILSCGDDAFHKTIKITKAGTIEYFAFSPRGFSGFPGRGMAALEMYYRSGGTTTSASNPLKCEYDEIWVEKAYADTGRVADVAYTYWKDDHFQVTIAYAAADPRYVPRSVLSKDGKPSELEIFLHRLIDGEWFVFDHVSDRVWFDDAVKSLDKLG